MRLGWDGLYNLCQANLVEVKFTRRLPFAGRPPSRRMLATLDGQLLNTKEGMEILNLNSEIISKILTWPITTLLIIPIIYLFFREIINNRQILLFSIFSLSKL